MQKEPDIQFGPLSLWVLGRQFSDHHDYWDGNWLNVRARVVASGMSVEMEGPYLHLSPLLSFITELERLDRTIEGEATLRSWEPNLELTIQGDRRGGAHVITCITPDWEKQRHAVTVDLDQTNYKPLIAACRNILKDYPMRGGR